MIAEKQITKNHLKDKTNSYLKYETVDTCPICKSKIAPIYIASSLDSLKFASVFDYCRSCRNTFITKYKVNEEPHTSTIWYIATEAIYSEPNRFEKQVFDNKIITLSPQFDKIYNQALAAETNGLDEIAGLGYRKALEFLIKDYAIHIRPDEESTIKAKPIAQCINSYIDNEAIKTLAERSAWIGNDEAHYIRKKDDRDVSDMKSFIQAIVYFIGMILITEDAASMEPK